MELHNMEDDEFRPNGGTRLLPRRACLALRESEIGVSPNIDDLESQGLMSFPLDLGLNKRPLVTI